MTPASQVASEQSAPLRDRAAHEMHAAPERQRKIIHIDMDAFYASV
jgi:hypothetical protein